MLDHATEGYSCDASTSAEKEDTDIVTTKLADIGKKRDGSVIIVEKPEVSAVANSTTFTDTLDVTLHVMNATSATYSVDGGAAVSFTDGSVITLGADKEVGDITVLTVTAVSKDGITASESYTYTKVQGQEEADAIYFKKPAGWGSDINIYLYDERSGSAKIVAPWPGVAMAYYGDDFYSYTVPEDWEYANVIFNDGSNQIPAVTGFVYDGESMIYDEGWAGFTSLPPIEVKKVSFNNSKLNWSNVNVYIYDESSSPIKEIAAWPGVSMTNEGDNLFTYEFKEGWSDPKVIFNDGSGTQIPGSGQTGLSLTGDLMYSGGNWPY